MNEEKPYFDLTKIIRFQNGDQNAFEEIYEYYKEHIYFMAYQYFKDEEMAKDIVQNTFMIIAKKIHTLQSPEAFFVWMEQIAYRCCLQETRKRKSRKSDGIVEYNDEVRYDLHKVTTAIDKVQLQEAGKIIFETLEQMKEQHRLVGFLRFYEELSVKEIAEIVQIPEGTVMSRLSKIRTVLKDALDKRNFNRETCFVLLAAPNLVGFYKAFAAAQKPVHIPKFDTGEIAKVKQYGGATITATILLASLGICAFVIHDRVSPQGISVNDQNVEEYAKITDIQYAKEKTNQNLNLTIHTSNDEYDEIKVNEQARTVITQNGEYRITLWKQDVLLDEQSITITNIDKDVPIATEEEITQDYIVFSLADEGSGVDYANIRYLQNGQASDAFVIDEDKQTVRVQVNDMMDGQLVVPDRVGNMLHVNVNIIEK